MRALLISVAALLILAAPASAQDDPVQGAIGAFRGGENVYLAPNGPQGFNSHIADLYQQQIDKAARQHPAPAAGQFALVFEREHDRGHALDNEECDQHDGKRQGRTQRRSQ